ncbi:type 1 glutamine amidotransferase [Microbispora sp. ATCC PTA-5024]|uniref:type 1 glutamine amidotransferase n=1 Tax=Microbispora sp. ATCC PTA-5024 TaxID=316330 RepID=UPI0003DD63BF|nr:type 1 glutamine amidotransferase [Microbispora sp. ATCC PTA-5024]ETK38011.1 aminotransferase [Microbispora sp. ATCC PTA-5024]
MSGKPRVLAVQSGRDSGPARFGAWLAEAGLVVEVVAGCDGDPLPPPLGHDALLVLGGGYLPDDDDRAPWLPATRALVTRALETEVPLFGICLGGQMLAAVAGGRVRGDAGAPEQGSTPVTIRSEAAGDPLFHDLPGVVPAIEHHVDAITELPPGAVWLAETERCPYQAFRVGRRAWGVQFHPEAAPERIRGWDADTLRRQGFDPDGLYAAAVADDRVSAPVWHTVATRFAEVVRGARATGWRATG